jgi:hypothetical protein
MQRMDAAFPFHPSVHIQKVERGFEGLSIFMRFNQAFWSNNACTIFAPTGYVDEELYMHH